MHTGCGHKGILHFGKVYFKVFKDRRKCIVSIYYKELKESFKLKKKKKGHSDHDHTTSLSPKMKKPESYVEAQGVEQGAFHVA